MKLSLVERETILLYNQAEPMAEVYTHDPRLMEKLELLAKSTRTKFAKRTPKFYRSQAVCISQGAIQRRASQSCQ